MKTLVLSTALLAAFGSAALAQSVSPGHAQLAAIAGVSATDYSINEIQRLLDARADGDTVTENFILQGGASAGPTATLGTTSAMGSVNPGTQQLANALGLDATQYSANELVRLYNDRFGSDD